jgi:hypothetical protein
MVTDLSSQYLRLIPHCPHLLAASPGRLATGQPGAHVLLGRHGADLPVSLHLVAQAPVPDPVRLRVAVLRAARGPGGADLAGGIHHDPGHESSSSLRAAVALGVPVAGGLVAGALRP